MAVPHALATLRPVAPPPGAVASSPATSRSTSSDQEENRQLTLLVTGRCRRCAERIPGGAALREAACPQCGTATLRDTEDRAAVLSAFESRAWARTWVAILVAAGIVLVAGWAPAVAGFVMFGVVIWVQLALVGPAARLFSVQRRLVATWTFRLVAASVSAFGVVLVELLTVIPFIGVIGKIAAAAIHVALLAGAARRYMGWQTRREACGVRVSWGEYVLLTLAVLCIVAGASAAFWVALKLVAKASALVAGVDTLAAAGPPLGAESLSWASTLGLGAVTGTRASLFLLVSGLLSHVTPALVPQQLHFTGDALGLGIAVGLVVFELVTERDDDLQMTFGIATGGARVAAAGLLAAFGSGQAPSSSAALLAGAMGAGVALAASASRLWLHSAMRQLETEAFSPRKWLNRLEEGGVAGVAVAVYVGPMLAAGFVLVAFLAMLIARVVARSVERKWRRRCPQCGASIRVEASGCPRCGCDVPVARDVIASAVGLASSAWSAVTRPNQV